MNKQVVRDYRDNDELRNAFFSLADCVFNLNLRPWYEKGYWNEKYLPYSIVVDQRIIANVSVNIMNVEFSDCVHKYIQLGTVMTDPEFRNRGLIRQLMEVIFHDYKTADGFFLFANDQVKSFYPLFNFQSQTEYRYALIPKPVKNAVVQLTMNGDQNGKRFLELKQRMHSLAAVEFDNDELMMFYLISINQHDVYYIAVYDALLIARLSAGVLNVYAIYSSQDVSPAQICECWMVQYDYALFHFNPRDKHAMIKKPFAEENTTLFVKGHKLISDLNRIEVIPLLAHA